MPKGCLVPYAMYTFIDYGNGEEDTEGGEINVMSGQNRDNYEDLIGNSQRIKGQIVINFTMGDNRKEIHIFKDHITIVGDS